TLGSEIVPASPAASANGTVRPSDIPMTTSRTVSVAVKSAVIDGGCAHDSVSAQGKLIDAHALIAITVSGAYGPWRPYEIVGVSAALIARRAVGERPSRHRKDANGTG